MPGPQRKLSAHDRWACFACRRSVKRPLVDARVADRPSYLCPLCRQRMTYTGSAFRPPKHDDDEAWQVAERLIRAGHLFEATRVRQRRPRTLREVEPWLAARVEDPGWLPEQPLAWDGGRLRSGTRIVRDDEPVLVLVARGWQEGRVRTTGDGGRALGTPVIEIRANRRRYIAITEKPRVRLRRRAR